MTDIRMERVKYVKGLEARIAELKQLAFQRGSALQHIASHFGSAEQCREIALAALKDKP